MQDVNMRNLGTHLARHVKDTRTKGKEAQETLERIAGLMDYSSVDSLILHLEREWQDQRRVQTAHIPSKPVVIL